MKKMMIQITSGKGPAECCRAVACVQSLMIKQARQQGIQIEVLENKAGDLNGTLLSATMMATGHHVESFVKEWTGTIQWIAQSPYRKYHKRKNWAYDCINHKHFLLGLTFSFIFDHVYAAH